MTDTHSSRPSLAAVAARAGVSVSTVSRVLSGRGSAAPDTRARIFEAADALHYNRGGERRGRPRQNNSRLIDLVLGQFHDSWADEVFAGARTAAVAAGYDLVVTSERESAADDWPARIQQRGSAGAVVGLIVPTSAQVSILERTGIPIVLLDPRGEVRAQMTEVGSTDFHGGELAAEHLIAAGATRFVAVVGAPSYRFGRARLNGFLQYLTARRPGAQVDVVSSPWQAHEARDACLDPLRDSLAATGTGAGAVGVFACADEIAYGVYAAAAELGTRVPDDLQVVGFDDFRDSKWVDPPLTSVHQPVRAMAAEAIRLLHQTALGEPLPPTRYELSTTLTVRKSTLIGGPPPSDAGTGATFLLARSHEARPDHRP